MATSVQDERLPFVRLLHRGLDLSGFFDAADRTLQRIVPFEASCWLSLDPGVVLPTSHFSREYGFEHLMQLVANEFIEEDANKFAVLARAARPVGILSQATDGDLGRSPRYRDFLAPHGFADGDELRAVFRDGEAVWGAVALHRQRGVFSELEADRIADVGSLLAHGIRRAILKTALTAGWDPQPPGLIVLRDDDTIDSLTPAATSWLTEIFDTTAKPGMASLPMSGVAHQARRAAAGQTDEVATVRLPRRSGGWLRMDASMLDGPEPGQVAVIISAAREPEVAELIAQVYGLSAREREVTRLAMYGLSTQEMAESLHVSAYTIQDHLKSIFEKVGVRSRRELVAQLFLQQCAPKLTSGALPGADGWFADDPPAPALPQDPIAAS
jgi:DNA-binding CsgD family transcriptional regulator